MHNHKNLPLMNPAFFVWSYLLLCFKTTNSVSLGQQLVVKSGQGGNGNDVMNKKCIDNERHALLDFKSHLQDPDGLLSSWRAEEEEEDCCKWCGIICNSQTGNVIKLELSGNRLEGEISPSLLNLTYLTYLDFSGNYFNGTIPVSIGSLTGLIYLDLGSNRFNGTIPKSIGSLTELRHLDLSNNSLYGTIPPDFRKLSNLEKLLLSYLRGCTFENLDWLSHMSHLHRLDMQGSSLANADNWVNVILSLQKLSYLNLSDCELSEVIHPYSSSVNSTSSSLSNIIYLDLEENNLNSSMYHWLLPLTSNRLSTLDLSQNMLDGIPKFLGNLCNLTSLYLSRNSIAAGFSDFLNNLSGCTSVTLQVLDASRNQLTGSLPDEIQMFSSLKSLYLYDNQLNGSISEKVWEQPKLQSLDVSSNYLRVRGDISQNIGKSKLSYIDLSNSSLEGVPSKSQTSNLSYLEYVDLSSCKLGPYFPKWIQALKNLTYLNISNNGISDTIPSEFLSNWPYQLKYLDLSLNNISGKIPDFVSTFDPLHKTKIDLSSNTFSGPIVNVPSTLEKLDLYSNKFHGGINFLCQIVDGFLTYLDLSHNSFTGEIPDCLWHFKKLKVLNLAHNDLFGKLPASLESLIELELLCVYNNAFSGEFPLPLRNCTKLTFLDLGVNRFSGNVPVWIGEKLSRLYVLSLSSNDFFGPIPLQLCHLVHLQILDLSMNDLYGTIPSCVDNLTTMIQQAFNVTLHSSRSANSGYSLNDYLDHMMFKWQGIVREFSSVNLGLLMFIDLSSNNLTGGIPYEFTNLNGLIALNLSRNALRGEIPWNIGEMKKLLTLDLSRNSLSGGMPLSMSQMTSLGYLDVSKNNLSGRIPSSTQLQSFEPSRYTGNPRLCGPPMIKKCLEDDESQVSPTIGESKGDGEDDDEFQRWFFIGGASGFATGFCIVGSVLLLYCRQRHAFFYLLVILKDWVYVKVTVFIRK